MRGIFLRGGIDHFFCSYTLCRVFVLNFGTDCNLIAVFLLCHEMIVFIFGMQEYLSSSVFFGSVCRRYLGTFSPERSSRCSSRMNASRSSSITAEALLSRIKIFGINIRVYKTMLEKRVFLTRSSMDNFIKKTFLHCNPFKIRLSNILTIYRYPPTCRYSQNMK